MQAHDDTNDAHDLFYDRGNRRLYYIHQSGLTFTAKMAELANDHENEQPHEVRLVAGRPMSATSYVADDDSPEGRVVIAWCETMDAQIDYIVRAAAASMSSTLKVAA